jgi:hypothetical protein
VQPLLQQGFLTIKQTAPLLAALFKPTAAVTFALTHQVEVLLFKRV